MKRLAVLFGLAVIGFGPGVGAQTLLTNLSLAESATATAASSDYRYTKHRVSGGGRGGHTITFYSWDPFVDQTTSSTLAMVLNGSSGSATATGSYYASTYSATTSAATSLSNTATKSVFTTTYSATTTLTPPQVAHQNVTVTAHPGGTFSFTLTDYTDVKVTATGSDNGDFRLFGTGVGVVLGPLYGAGTLTTESSLPPGDYWITNGLTYTAEQDTQLNILLNSGTTSASYSFTVTFTQGSADSGGDS